MPPSVPPGVPPCRSYLLRGDLGHEEAEAAPTWNGSPELQGASKQPMPGILAGPWAVTLADAVYEVHHADDASYIHFISVGDAMLL